MPPDTPPRRHRSRRLRKKLHLGEFRECGFALSFCFPDAMPEDERPDRDQPFYHVIAEGLEDEHSAYVSEQNLVPDDSGEHQPSDDGQPYLQ